MPHIKNILKEKNEKALQEIWKLEEKNKKEVVVSFERISGIDLTTAEETTTNKNSKGFFTDVPLANQNSFQ